MDLKWKKYRFIHFSKLVYGMTFDDVPLVKRGQG